MRGWSARTRIVATAGAVVAMMAIVAAAPGVWRGPALHITLTNRTAAPIERVRFAHHAGEAVVPAVGVGETVRLTLPVGWRGPSVVPIDFRFAQGGREARPFAVRFDAGGLGGREVEYLVDDHPNGDLHAFAEVEARRDFSRQRFFAVARDNPWNLARAWEMASPRRVHVAGRRVLGENLAVRRAREYFEDSRHYLRIHGWRPARRVALAILIGEALTDDARRAFRRPRRLPVRTLPITAESELAEIPLDLQIFYRIGATGRLGDGHF